jgi:hypothetical protein
VESHHFIRSRSSLEYLTRCHEAPDATTKGQEGRQYIRASSRISLYGTFDVKSYTLVRLSNLEGSQILETLDSLGRLDEILSIEELKDGSWELPVLKSYFPKLETQLCRIFPGCDIEQSNNPTEPRKEEVEQYGKEVAKHLTIIAFYERAERMKVEGFPGAIAFYSHLLDKVRPAGQGATWV